MTSQVQKRGLFAILDSVGVIYFGASRQTRLLTRVLIAEGRTVCIPAEVRQESENRILTRRWDVSDLRSELASGRLNEIPEITAAQPASMKRFQEVRRDHPAGTSGDRNLGECIVVVRALEAQRAGTVVVGMDDLDAQTLAIEKHLAYFTVEDVIVRGVELAIITKAQAKNAYEAMLPYGTSLPSWTTAQELRSRLGFTR